MLLLLSNSMDGTSDVLCRLCGEQEIKCFRFNIDLYAHYEVKWLLDGFEIKDPTGRSVKSKNVTSAYWRKPHFLADPPVERVGNGITELEWAEAQVLYIVNEIANWCRRRGVLRLVEPRAERRVGKISQMILAGKYFNVPKWETGWGMNLDQGSRIVKSLDARLIDDGRFLYARSVDTGLLDTGFPWLVQDIAPGSHDATVVYIVGECFGFLFATPRSEGCEDWRRTINTTDCRWNSWQIPALLVESIRAFMAVAGLKFGRLDFVISSQEEWFLEVNPNGQFGWLDDEKLIIHRHILRALLDPSATIDQTGPV